jgi:hypothetical protein
MLHNHRQGTLPRVGQFGKFFLSTNGHTCFASYNSINCWSIDRDFGCEKRLYSSNIDVWLQFCSFLKHPIKQPVRCCHFQLFMLPTWLLLFITILPFTFPLLQCIKIGWLRLSMPYILAHKYLFLLLFFKVNYLI